MLNRLQLPTDVVFLIVFWGSVRFQGKQCSEHTPSYYKLYQAAEIRSRSAATRCTWMTRRRASETLWLM